MVTVGDPAPDITLKDREGKEWKLRDQRGKKVLLAFFPFAFSPVCTDEFRCFETDLSAFQKKGVMVFGVSVDSHWSNKAFAEKLGISFPLLSDFSKEASKAFGVLRKEGFSERAYFLIDEQGIIQYKHIMDNPGKKLEDEELLNCL